MNINLPYKPHKLQKLLHNDVSRYQTVVAGRRFGKSFFARWSIILNAQATPGRYWIVSPTIKQGKDNHWNDPQNNLLLDTQEFRSYENSSDLAIELPCLGNRGKSRIELKGIENLQKTRGPGLKGVVLDEAAYLTRYSWEGVIRPMILTGRGWVKFIGTPFGMNWFKDIYDQGKVNTRIVKKKFKHKKGTVPIWVAERIKSKPKSALYRDWSSYRFTSYDYPKNDRWDLDLIRQESIEKGKEDWFHTEYLADFRKVTGIIYGQFSEEKHTVEPFAIPNDWKMYCGLDFGFNNPTACLWIAEAPEGELYVVDEYYEQQQSSDYHCGIILSKSDVYPSIQTTYGDPSAPQIMEDWARKGVYITPARRDAGTNRGEWVGHGIDLVQEKLKIDARTKQPRLKVFNTCKNTVREFLGYRWKEEKNEELNKPGRPEKANDHALDALRYFMVSHQKSDFDDFEIPDDTRLFGEGGYY